MSRHLNPLKAKPQEVFVFSNTSNTQYLDDYGKANYSKHCFPLIRPAIQHPCFRRGWFHPNQAPPGSELAFSVRWLGIQGSRCWFLRPSGRDVDLLQLGHSWRDCALSWESWEYLACWLVASICFLFCFTPLFGEDESVLTHIFQTGLKPSTRYVRIVRTGGKKNLNEGGGGG